jgi:hypothetical protein
MATLTTCTIGDILKDIQSLEATSEATTEDSNATRSQKVPATQAATKAETPKAETPRLAAGSIEEDFANQPLGQFGAYLNMVQFAFLANNTVMVPTAHAYVASLGGGGWFAGWLIAAGVGAGLVTSPSGTRLFNNKYKPALLIFALSCALGNAAYGLGEFAQSRWLLMAAQVVRSLFWGCCGRSLAQHAICSCAGKNTRSSETALQGNIGFLGMGAGPLIGACLTKINFRLGLLQFDEFTNPGWFFAAVWMLMAVWLLCIAEPERMFEIQKTADGKTSVDPVVSWCMASVGVTSGIIAAWETSASIVTQKYYGWHVMTTCLFVGVCFLSSMASGEVVRVVLKRVSVNEAKVVFIAYAMTLVGSICLYWYAGDDASVSSRTTNEVMYIIGSCLVLAGANAVRTYALSIGMRKAMSISKAAKDRATVWQAVTSTLGRAIFALLGMAFAAMPGGPNLAAALVTVSVGLIMSLLTVPGLFTGLYDA